MSKVLILGYLGYASGRLDGQTVKTRSMLRLAREQYGDVGYYDTEEFRSAPLSIFRLMIQLMRCRLLIYLPAHNNLKYMFPVVYCMSVLFGFRIHYFVVGGWLKEFLEDLPLHRWMLRRISGIHVETMSMKEELADHFSITKVDVFPNFRFFDHEPRNEISDRLRLVFMARINRMKGLNWIFGLARYIEENDLAERCSITFWGPVWPDDREYFESEVDSFPFVEYRGTLQPDEIYQELENYDVMLLPTHYYTEGLPGSIVDACICGLPVIVTEWKHAHEFVEDQVTGFIIPFKDGQDELNACVRRLCDDRDLLAVMKSNVLKRRNMYSPPSLSDYIE